MQTRNLGSAALPVSAIGLGCMGFSQAYGPADDDESVSTLRRAIDVGVTLLDTAMSYGAGHNEELVGRAIVGRRDRVVVATKFGIVRSDDGSVRVDGRPENVRGYCEASLARLGVDTIDLYYQHRVDPNVPIEETVGAMSDLVEDDVVPTARGLGVGIVAYSPLGRGFLTGAVSTAAFDADDFRRNDPRFGGAELARNQTVIDALKRLAAAHGVTPAQLTLAWLLAQGDDVVPIPGTRRQARLEENAAAVTVELTADDLDRLETVAPRSAWAGDRQSFAAHGTSRHPT